MAKIEAYECEKCKTLFRTGIDATICQDKHVSAVRIQEEVWERADSKPYRLKVLMVDGSIALYKFVGTQESESKLHPYSCELKQCKYWNGVYCEQIKECEN